MPTSIQLTYTPQKVAQQSYQAAFTAVGTGVDSNVFVMRRRPVNPATGAQQAYFDHVATPADLANLPVSAPLAGGDTFRVATFTNVFNVQADALTFFQALQGSVNALIRALNVSAQAGNPITVVLTG